MILTVDKINKKYNNSEKIINDFSYCFKKNTFYCIVGKSGCGKTTLLNLLSGLQTADSGAVKYNDIDIHSLNIKKLKDFRLQNFGFIFQDFKLFENDTVFNNVYLISDTISLQKKDIKERKVFNVLDLVGIKKLFNKQVAKLSGGEKQRVSIARALINNPKIIFADEPTGSLDYLNADKIFSILSSISNRTTIICVTHDQKLAAKYADVILKFEENKIVEIINNNNKKVVKTNIEKKNDKTNVLSDKFISNHYKNSIKAHKLRWLFMVSLLTISISTTGLSFSLKENISCALENAFSSVMNENTLVLKRKNDDYGIKDYLSVSYNDVLNIKNNYDDYIEYIGSRYISNLEDFYKDCNQVRLLSKKGSLLFDRLNARSFSEFILLDENDLNIEGKYKNLKTDEVVLGLDFQSMRLICKYYDVDKSFDSLNFLVENSVINLSLNVANNDWTYDDQINFRIVGVKESSKCCIYHTDELFNEKLYEDQMRFPSSTNLRKIEEYPWVLKKIYYIKIKEEQHDFLNLISFDKRFQNFLFDNDSILYTPTQNEISIPSKNSFLFVYKVLKNDLPLFLIEQNKKINSKLSNYYLSSNGGYVNYGTSLFTGFSKQTFFSNSMENINVIIDACSRVIDDDVNNMVLPKNTLSAYYANLSDENVRICSNNKEIIYGSSPKEYNEIVVSTSFANELNIGVNSEIYISQIIDKNLIDNYLSYTFKTASLFVTGIFESEEMLISGNEYFSISLFRDVLKNSIFDLIPNAIVYEFDNAISDSDLDKLNSYYDDFKFINPFDEIDLGVNEILSSLQYILFALSLVATISSIFLLIIICYIQIVEYKNDYYILSIIGYRNSELIKISTYSILANSVIALIVSSISMFFVSFFIGKAIGNMLNLSASFTISYKPFLVMVLTTLFIVSISSLISKIPIRKLN